MLTLKAPPHFSLDQTFEVIQRGSIDPMTCHINARWRRCFEINNKRCLIELYQKKHICINILSGDTSSNSCKKILTVLLGLDDPLLQNHSKSVLTSTQYSHLHSRALPSYSTPFEAIVQIILGQQVSVTVANKMRCSFIKKLGDHINYENKKYYLFPKPNQIDSLTPPLLKKIGMSTTKAISIIETAHRFQNKSWVSELTHPSTPSKRQYDLLTEIHGIGEWTAAWFLLRALRRFNIVPSSDLVIRKALSWWWNSKTLLSSKEIDEKSHSLGNERGLVAYRIMYAYLHSNSHHQRT